MTSSAILNYPIKPIAELSINAKLSAALLSSLSEYREQLHGRRIWLACSGGRDSLALAAICVQLYRQGKLPFFPQLLHVDRGLQANSGVWAQHVGNWAKIQNIPCRILRAQVEGHDEQAARQARYDVMRAQLNQDDVLLLAHHADDQAETLLMRLVQGAGVKGLSAMQPWRIQTQGAHSIVLWRPWLTIKRADISAYAQRLKLPYIDDPTNEAGDNVRSGLRRDIMPILAKYNPNVIDNIARSAQLLNDAQVTINAQAAEDLQRTELASSQLSSAQRVLNIDELQQLPPYRQRQLLHYWLGQDEPLPPAKQLVDDVLKLSQIDDNDHQTALFWQGLKQSYTVRRYRQQLYRLSSDWLTWLQSPLINQAHTFNFSMTDIQVANSKSILINLRRDENFIWQLQILPNEIAQLLAPVKGKIEFTFAPLDRKQRVQTTLASRPQSGKKLYQNLAIPSWMRESLVVVSVVFDNEFSIEQQLPIQHPILLVSPFESWILNSDDSGFDINSKAFANIINNNLSLNNRL